MRAVGFYPSAADINNLLSHVNFLADTAPADDAGVVSGAGAVIASTDGSAASRQHSATGTMKQKAAGDSAQAVDTGSIPEQGGVDFETLLCLYVNHRPVMGLCQQQIESAFKALGADTAAGDSPVGLAHSTLGPTESGTHWLCSTVVAVTQIIATTTGAARQKISYCAAS